MNSTVIMNSGSHTLTDDKTIKNPFNENNAATTKIK